MLIWTAPTLVERGEHNLTMMNIVKIAAALPIKPFELLGSADPAGEEAAEQFSGVALAKKYFEHLCNRILDGTGVQIVEGDQPGSSCYAAVLK